MQKVAKELLDLLKKGKHSFPKSNKFDIDLFDIHYLFHLLISREKNDLISLGIKLIIKIIIIFKVIKIKII
jgi:hypothetical protein